MSSEDAYAEIAPYYDLEFDEFDADFELYLGYASMVGGPVLELGCGSGRVLERLALAEFDVTGLDNSASMLQRARSRLENAGTKSNVRLIEGDMRDLAGLERESFRLVLISVNSFLHLDSRADQIVALSQIRNVLDRDGLLVIDVFNPTPETLTRMDDRYAFDGEWQLEDGRVLQRFSYRTLDSSRQRIMTRLFYDHISADGTVHRQSTRYAMRYLHRFELEGLLEVCGFELEGTYGSYSLDPIDHASEQLIVVAHRTANPGES